MSRDPCETARALLHWNRCAQLAQMVEGVAVGSCHPEELPGPGLTARGVIRAQVFRGSS